MQNPLKTLFLHFMRLYQRYLSPDHSLWARAMDRPPYCKHIPSCSNYMIEAVEKKGLIIGTMKGTYRVMRCNPWSKGGYDPVEKATSTK